MKKFALAMAAAAALMFTAPVLTGTGFTTPAAAETVVKKKIVIKRGMDRGRHMGWRHRGGRNVVIVKKRGGMHHGGMHRGRTVIKKTIVR